MSTRSYRTEIFRRLTETGLEDFDDKEVLELHQEASDLFEEATVYDEEDDLNDYHARLLYRESLNMLKTMNVVRELEKGDSI